MQTTTQETLLQGFQFRYFSEYSSIMLSVHIITSNIAFCAELILISMNMTHQLKHRHVQEKS